MYYLAKARMDYGEYDEAAQVYTDMLKLKKDPEVYFRRGTVYLKLGEPEKAAATLTPPWRTAGTTICICGSGNPIRMRIRIWKGSLSGPRFEIKPKEAQDYSSRGRVYYEMKDYDSAREELTRAIQEGDDEAVLILGKVYLAMEDAASARGMYQEYLQDGGKRRQGLQWTGAVRYL